MSDDPIHDDINDETHLADLTVGEFKGLLRQLLSEMLPADNHQQPKTPAPRPPEKVKTLDELLKG